MSVVTDSAPFQHSSGFIDIYWSNQIIWLLQSLEMNGPFYNTHVKLLAFDLLSLTQTRLASNSSSETMLAFSRKGLPLSRAEIVGIVTSRDHKPDKFLRFSIDDGTGCVPCILWLNQLTSSYLARSKSPSDVRLLADAAVDFANLIKHGVVARVRGRITSYRGVVQITVSDVVVERDPNAEMLHWLDCLYLARNCYDVVKFPSRN